MKITIARNIDINTLKGRQIEELNEFDIVEYNVNIPLKKVKVSIRFNQLRAETFTFPFETWPVKIENMNDWVRAKMQTMVDNLTNEG